MSMLLEVDQRKQNIFRGFRKYLLYPLLLKKMKLKKRADRYNNNSNQYEKAQLFTYPEDISAHVAMVSRLTWNILGKYNYF